MNHTTLKFLMVAAACSALLSACGSDGVSLSAGTGRGLATAQNGGGGSDSAGLSSGSGNGGGAGDSAGSNNGNGSGGSGNGSGSSSGSAPSLIGNGAVTVTANGTTAGTPPLLDNPVIKPVTSTVDALLTTGNAALPLGTVASAVQPVTSVLPVSAMVSNAHLAGGSGAQPIGVSILSNTEATGSIASVNLASGGKTADVTVLGTGVTSLPSTVVQTAKSVTAPIASAVTGATSGVLDGTSVLANANVGHTTLVSGSDPLVGVSAASGTQNQGSLLTVGAISAGKPLTLKVGDKSLLPTGGH